MGLFSFIKGAGAKILGRKKTPVVTEEATAGPSKEDLLKAEIERLGLPIDNLRVELAEQVIVTGGTQTNADREKIILALGNIEGVGCVEDNIEVLNPEPESRFHAVQSGDTLSKISKDVYDDPMKYNIIFEANRPMLEHPDKIYPGQILRIPVLEA